jgi:hypothetical protein
MLTESRIAEPLVKERHLMINEKAAVGAIVFSQKTLALSSLSHSNS